MGLHLKSKATKVFPASMALSKRCYCCDRPALSVLNCARLMVGPLTCVPCVLAWQVMLSTFERRRSQREVINEMPLYPTEGLLWDENQIPSVTYTGEGCLALPKLNLQFLTPHDYLLRNFNLFRYRGMGRWTDQHKSVPASPIAPWQA